MEATSPALPMQLQLQSPASAGKHLYADASIEAAPESPVAGSSLHYIDDVQPLPVRQMLQLSPQRTQSLSPERRRSTHQFRSLADWGMSEAPLWLPHEQLPPEAISSPRTHRAGSISSDHAVSSPEGSPNAQSRLRHMRSRSSLAATAGSSASSVGSSFEGESQTTALHRTRSPVTRTNTIDVGAFLAESPRGGGGYSAFTSPMAHASSGSGSPRSRFRPSILSMQETAALQSSSVTAAYAQEDAQGGGGEEGVMMQRLAALQLEVERERAEVQQKQERLRTQEAELLALQGQLRKTAQVRAFVPTLPTA